MSKTLQVWPNIALIWPYIHFNGTLLTGTWAAHSYLPEVAQASTGELSPPCGSSLTPREPNVASYGLAREFTSNENPKRPKYLTIGYPGILY